MRGWPGAERAIAVGHRSRVRERADEGDITGTPCLAWQITDRADIETPVVFARRMADTEAQRAAADAHYGLLVQRRRGAADAGRWWVHLPGTALADLLQAREAPVVECTVRVTLAELAPLLRRAGYGSVLITTQPREEHA